MRTVKFVCNGFPDKTHLLAALDLAQKHSGEMSKGESKKFGSAHLQTTIQIQNNDDILITLVNTNKL